MKILIVSGTCSPDKYKEIDQQRCVKLLGPQQKFFHLLIQGFISAKDVSVKCLTAVPVSASSHPKKIWRRECEEPENNLHYTYLSFINGKILRFTTLYLSTYFACKKWLKANKDEPDKVILCDPLLAHCAVAANRAGKKYGCKTVAIITDLPQYITSMGITAGGGIRMFLQKRYDKFSSKEMERYDAYIFLTAQMNEIINQSRQPYLVMEGSVDSAMEDRENRLEQKERPLSLVYAGGVHEKFGVGKLARAFVKTNREDVVLKIYGAGEHVDAIQEIEKQDSRIKYMGVAPMEEIVEQEIHATLLVNPRPTEEEYTRYSFPSKTTEYMVSGTPVLSTRLPGIPKEYEEHLYWFEQETEDKMASRLEEILNKDRQELHRFGLQAKQFVLLEKNNVAQAKKIMEFIQNV